jgi:hypothetical protein
MIATLVLAFAVAGLICGILWLIDLGSRQSAKST